MPHEHVPTWGPGGAGGALARLRGPRRPVIDAHLHAVSFLQEGPGLEALLEQMDRANVEKAVVFGLPVMKSWDEWDREAPDYYLASDSRCYYYAQTDEILASRVRALPAGKRARLYPLLCGLNPTDKFAVRHVERVLAAHPGLFRGIGELLLRHDDLTGLTSGDTPRANHRALWPVYELAAERGLPVLVHHNVTSVSRGDHPLYLPEFEEAVREFPRTEFVFAHCGMSRRVNVPFYPQMVRRLLEQYPNLTADLSWIIYDVTICPAGVPDPAWVALAERFSDRMVIGSDLVARFERLGPELERYDVFLERLSEGAGENLRRATAERVYGRRDAARRAACEIPGWPPPET